MVAEVRDALLQVFALFRRHLAGFGLLQFSQDALGRMMLVLEIVTLFIKPLLALLVVLANRRSRARQILRRMVEVQNLLINVGTKKIPVGSCAIRNSDKMRCRIQRLYPNNLTLHAIEKCLFSILWRRSHINRMQTLAMLVVERKASCHRFAPLLVADQHAGAID